MKLRRVFLIIGGATAIVVFIACGILLWRLPQIQIASLSKTKGVNAQDVFKAENEARATLAQTIATLAQIVGGVAILFGAYSAWKNIVATNENLRLTNQNLELTKEGQVTERFTKAIEQLGATDDEGKPKLELRLGGIYALEQIARDSEKDHWPIMEILTAYVRENSQWKEDNLPAKTLAADIQAILRVIRLVLLHYEISRNPYLAGHFTLRAS